MPEYRISEELYRWLETGLMYEGSIDVIDTLQQLRLVPQVVPLDLSKVKRFKVTGKTTWTTFDGEWVRFSDLQSLTMPDQKQCHWKQDEDGNWHTDCKNMFILNDGSPKENNMGFCCYCGGKLVENKAKP